MISADEIVQYLCSKGINCQKLVVGDKDIISVEFKVEDTVIELLHFPSKEITGLPAFYLSSPNDFGHLAHVTIVNLSGVDVGCICVNDRDSVSVNFSMPLMAIEESFKRHIAILSKGISDPAWNRKELLREFKSCWLNVCSFEDRPVLLTSECGELEEIDVYRPVSNRNYGVSSYYLAKSKDSELSPIASLYWTDCSKRTKAGNAIILPLENLDPAPLKAEDLSKWYLQAVKYVQPKVYEQLQTKYGRWKSTEYWIVFNAVVPSGKVWFALSFKSKKKHSLPLTEMQLKNWSIKATPIRHLNKEAVLPRGGANLNLATTNVALIGAGSVGCEVAHKLSAAGVQNLDIYDPDIYSIDNLYRHSLPEEFLHCYKSSALSFQLKRQFLWSKADGFTGKLLDLRNKQRLMSYDLIVIAIGSPTHERLFKEYLLEKGVDVPVINTWLEGFGVGGHAVLDIPESKGCLLCAYVCPDSLKRGLSSNLNFIEPNQEITINLSGCGEQFISYGAICSAQTALIASDLAIKFLEGKIKNSSKVSWKGSDADAKNKNIALTDRYYQFAASLQLKALHHEDCDVCS
jgi:hypothetical protein